MNQKTESPLLARIRKLMAKAQDPSVTEAEAMAFADKVQELLLREGLAMSDVAASGEEQRAEAVGEEKFDFKRWNSPHRRDLLGAVCAYYMCQVLYWRKLQMLKIIGKPQNVAVAASMTDYLIGTTVRLSTRYVREHPGANAIDFRRGCMLRLRERLYAAKAKMEREAARPAASTNPGNLPVLFQSESQLVANFVASAYTVRTTKARAVKHGADAWAGRRAAEGISLSPQVGQRAGGDRRAIGRK